MPGEVRTVKEGDLAPRQTQTLVKQGLLQVVTGDGLLVTKKPKGPPPSTSNPQPVTSNRADQREVTNG